MHASLWERLFGMRERETERERVGGREEGRKEERKGGEKEPHSQRNLGSSWENQGLVLTSNI